jgi:hypothetical protein
MENSFKFDESQIKEAQLIFDKYSWSYDLEGINEAKKALEDSNNLINALGIGDNLEEIKLLRRTVDWAIMVLGSQLELRELSAEELKAKTDKIFGSNFKPNSESFEFQMKAFINNTFNEEEILFLQIKSELQHLLNTREEDNYILIAMAIRETHRLEFERNIPICEYPDNSWTQFKETFRGLIRQITYLRDDTNFIDWYANETANL